MTEEYLAKIREIKKTVAESPEYAFLREDHRISDWLTMLGLGGSYAYGTYTDGSDIDLRGVALNPPEEILLGNDFEQYTGFGSDTDTTIYSVRKIIKLLCEANPNIVELLGLADEQLFYKGCAWNTIKNNTGLFLSKKCVRSFGGYASAQLRRLETKSARATGQAQREAYILESIRMAEPIFRERYAKRPKDSIKLYLAESSREDFEKEIFIDADITGYPLRDFASVVNDYHSIVSGYDKVGKRNSKAIEHGKLGKHMMHLVRLYYTLFDILEDGKVITFREKERDFLMEIRGGRFLDEEMNILPEFYDVLEGLEDRAKRAAEKSSLPEAPDTEKVERLLMEINTEVMADYIEGNVSHS